MRIAVLGLGSAGARHAANAAALGHEVVGFDPEAADGTAGVERAGSEHEAIEGADAVVVATPSSLHGGQAIAALDAGRSVLVEKPLTARAEEAEGVAGAAEAAGAVCGVAMNLRFHPAVIELRRLVEAGDLGQVRLAEVAFGHDLRLWRPQSDYRASYSARADLGGGIALDGIHEIDYLLWLLGPVDAVTGETAQVSSLEVDVEDVAAAILRFGSGAIATVSLNFFEPAYRRRAVVVGEEAVAQWAWGEPELTVRGRSGASRSITVDADVDRTYLDVLADFVAAVENGASPRTPVADGVEAVRVVDALKRSSESGRRVEIRAG